MNVSDLTQSLSEYSPTVDQAVNAIVNSTKPMGYVLIGIFFLIEMDSWFRYMKQEGGGITGELWLDVAFKYFISFLLVSQSSLILEAMFELVSLIVQLMDKGLPAEAVDYNFTAGKIRGAFVKPIITTVGWLTEYAVYTSVKIISFMRYMQLALLKAVAPVLIATFMSDSTRQIAINVLKYFGAAALQAVVLIIIVRLYPALISDDLLKVNISGKGESLKIAFASIAKGIVFLFLIFGSQRQTQKLLGLMG
ncbi:type IV secretion system protein [Streptococcus canis]|uniref:TrbL/VirB6 plasmid conjugal transfer protein n=1 Tax=Streptococcus canis FSL Z3-227 TaxID=482234 RepID=A0AAV3FU97_STRCB|nr:type IV secretion system protein [Streptococcus canis]EIQ82688.1 hypothetical protein SCAZ3_10015 [Streptococcus canis FSL Z3-227]